MLVKWLPQIKLNYREAVWLSVTSKNVLIRDDVYMLRAGPDVVIFALSVTTFVSICTDS